jgi:hypothetical protein
VGIIHKAKTPEVQQNPAILDTDDTSSEMDTTFEVRLQLMTKL